MGVYAWRSLPAMMGYLLTSLHRKRRGTMFLSGFAVSWTCGFAAPLCAVPLQDARQFGQLRSGKVQLMLSPDAEGRVGLRVELRTKSANPVGFAQPVPLAVEIVGTDGHSAWLTGGYDHINSSKTSLRASGTLITPNGSRFRFDDSYKASSAANTFEMTRQVAVEKAAPLDAAFNSRFSLEGTRASTMSDNDFFAPGVWYRDNHNVPRAALAADQSAHFFLFREDRLPLPIIMRRDKRSGATLSMGHLNPDGGTFAGEDGLNRITDERLQFGSIGVENDGNAVGPQLSFLFPGSEGERTYIFGSKAQNRWALRSHPVRAGFSHRYQLAFSLHVTNDYPAAVRATWRTFYGLAQVPTVPADLNKVYRDGMALLTSYGHGYNGVPAVPFSATLPEGKDIDASSQMGFVGQALPAAFLILKNGLDMRDEEAITNARQIVDFWANNSLSESGIPRTWYDFPLNSPKGTFTWRSYPTFLRVASDGLSGVLDAWDAMHRNGREKPEWLAFCRRYGNWLVRVQNEDGSFFRAYSHEGKVVDNAKDTSVQPIRFLVDLHKVTGDVIFKTAALRAGEFCLRTIHDPYTYVGGTPDNPNVIDKEAGMVALESFLALYDLTGEKRWLDAAVQAADWSETWIYCWNVPMPPDAQNLVFPRNRTTYGLSLIATGHSGADNFMGGAPFLYYRLSLLTGDSHFRDIARMLLLNTKQLTDWDGTLGYGFPGLQSEALSLAPTRGKGVRAWLPWLTVGSIEPMMRLRDVFGDFDIADIEKLPAAERKRRNRQFGQTRGLTVQRKGDDPTISKRNVTQDDLK